MIEKTFIMSAEPPSKPEASGWLRILFSKSMTPKGPGRRRLRAAAPMLAVFGGIWLVYLSVVATVLVTDPYDIYRWGSKVQFTANDVPRDNVIRLIDAVAKKTDINTFLVGGSTTAMYSPDDIENALGGKTVAYNLSYGGPRPMDRDIVLDQLAAIARSDRIIMTFDWMYILDPESMRQGFPEFLYDREILDDIRMVDLAAVARTLQILTGKVQYDSKDGERYAKFVEQQYRAFQEKSKMAKLQVLIEQYRPVIDAPSGRSCSSFNAIDEQLVPTLRKFNEMGVEVDILIPILSYANYYFRMSDISPTLLDEVLLSRRCLVEAVEGLHNVRVFAFDHDPAIAGDLANFRDPGHVYNPEILKKTLTSISTGNNILNRSNIDDYERRIRTEVKSYRLKNSRMRISGNLK
jgi:hypothetical protein